MLARMSAGISGVVGDLPGRIARLRERARGRLAGRVVTVASGKGGVYVDLDWNDGCGSRALGWMREHRRRSPLLDALAASRPPRVIRGGPSRPDLVPGGPELGSNQPPQEVLGAALVAWCEQLEGYPLLIVPNRVPPGRMLDRLAAIAGRYRLPVTSALPHDIRLERRLARTAVCSRVSGRNAAWVDALNRIAGQVSDHATHTT